jgi:hypothetical protein
LTFYLAAFRPLKKSFFLLDFRLRFTSLSEDIMAMADGPDRQAARVADKPCRAWKLWVTIQEKSLSRRLGGNQHVNA